MMAQCNQGKRDGMYDFKGFDNSEVKKKWTLKTMTQKNTTSPDNGPPRRRNLMTKDEIQDNISLLIDSVPALDSLFTITDRIGHGTFSSVYLARTKHSATSINGRQHFAIKHIIPTSHPSRVLMELRCLKLIGGVHNVMGITMCFREMNHIVLVMPHFPHNPFSEYVGNLTIAELQDYMKNLLIALKHVHSFGIIHRDIKPANFLYNRRLRRYSLVDFGLAQEVGQMPVSLVTSAVEEAPSGSTTPQVPNAKTVKRKLTVSSVDTPPADKVVKRPRQFSPHSSSSASVLSPNANCINTTLRRSPRKHEQRGRSPRKENIATQSDSPSKNTRGAEAARRQKEVNGVETSASPGEEGSCLRRSPRKSMASSLSNLNNNNSGAKQQHGNQLEGLAKFLQDTLAKGSSCEVTSTRKLKETGTSRFASPHPSKTNSALQEVHTSKGRVLAPVMCSCYGSAKVCSICLTRSHPVAPRAGTPGFRAPEVLLRYPHQTTAVDLWSVGVVFVCLLSGRYPFFKAAEDLASLAEITTLLGSEAIRKAAARLESLYTTSQHRKPMDLMKVCQVLRNNEACSPAPEGAPKCSGCGQAQICVCLVPPGSTSSSIGKKSSKGGMESKTSVSHQIERRKTIAKDSSLMESSTISFACEKESEEVEIRRIKKTSKEKLGYEKSSDSSNNNISCGLSRLEDNCPGKDADDTRSSSSSSPEILYVSFVREQYPLSAYQLLSRLLDPNPCTRITAEDAINHPFLCS